MILAALLLPIAAIAVVLAIQRLRLPSWLALMAAVVGYGIAAEMTFQSIGRAFGLGFVAALEQTGLLVAAGSLVGTLMSNGVLKQPLPRTGAAVAGVLAGLGGSAAGALALLQPAGRSSTGAVALALSILAVHALVAPSPIAVAAMSVMEADLRTMLAIAIPVAALLVIAVWLLARRDGSTGAWSWSWLAIALPLGMLLVQAIAQMPSEPLGKGGAREFYTGISRSLILAVLAIALAVMLSRRWQPTLLADTSWAPLLLTVGAAGGMARVLDETGMPELLAERVLDPHLGLLVPFLAAAIVKTMQGNSLSAVLTASGMVEPMLSALGLDNATGRALAAAATGAGAIAICHINDPFFWIASNMAGLTPAKGLRAISVGSLLVASGIFVLLFGLSRVL